MSPSSIASVLGAILVVSGIGLVMYQLVFRPPPRGATRSAKISRSGFQARTNYPGIIMIGIGALLVILAMMIGAK